MKNRVKTFVHSQFGEIRTIVDEAGTPWFVGKDVASILGYAKPQNALASHVNEVDKTTALIQGTGSNYKTQALIINEYGLYDLVFASKLPQAQAFKRWVITEVLPQIRKTGGYIPVHDAEGNELSDEELIERAQSILQRTIDEKDALIAEQQQLLIEQRPKVLFAQAVEISEDSYTIGDVAHIISSNHIPMGRQRLFNWLRRKRYMHKNTRRPIQKWVEKGIFTVHIYVYRDSYGRRRSYSTTMITGKGVEYFLNIFSNH